MPKTRRQLAWKPTACWAQLLDLIYFSKYIHHQSNPWFEMKRGKSGTKLVMSNYQNFYISHHSTVQTLVTSRETSLDHKIQTSTPHLRIFRTTMTGFISAFSLLWNNIHYRCVSTVQHIFTLELLSSTLCGFAYPACILHHGYWLSLTYPVIQLCLKSTKYNRYKIILNGCVGNQLWSAFYCRFGVVVEPWFYEWVFLAAHSCPHYKLLIVSVEFD